VADHLFRIRLLEVLHLNPEYPRVRRDLERHPNTFVLLPSLDRDVCIAETVRRQIARPFGRSSAKEEAVIQARFEVYMSVPGRKIETMRPTSAAIDEIVAALSPRPVANPIGSR